jgi:large subunit ribosomal protein L11
LFSRLDRFQDRYFKARRPTVKTEIIMAKKLQGEVKFQVPGGQATPAPPVGTSLGRFGINLGQFVQQFNDRTKEAAGMPIPVVVNVYNDRSFDFVTKSPPAAALLKQAASIAKGSGVPNRTKVGTVTDQQLEDIVKLKLADLNASDIENAKRMIAGTARSMGLVVEG